MSLVELAQVILIAGLSLLSSLVVVLFIIQKAITSPFPVIKRRKEETHFLDPIAIQNVNFPSISDAPTLDLSVIIPAYNEEQRLPKMLEECVGFLEEKSRDNSFTYEIIVVSDGSSDGTVSLALKYSKRYTVDKFRVLELIENRGKGGAVRLGMLSARGRYLLFADADGATKFSDYDKLDQSINNISKDWQSDAIVVGSRAHLEQEAIATRSLFRTFLMHGFHFLVWLFAVRSIRDTQCGFKLLTRSAANTLFKNLHVERWAFDVELLYIAERLKFPIAEVAVTWKEIEGSKLTPVWSWIQMGVDLFLIWFRYTIGAWQLYDQNKEHSS
ncbi:PREDICTED: dolichyl-phosphate beta-glucosyltransferase [Rhagoletis zephyria]|uniref:dolichyl-phosphate beta-glucosyltransferase n=1 Tax=Rhagoletis zephyria TaxID=28612 RepID=UPI0008115675|nr:PREDICTED: dolichyl-phosphate beta-glucosyltransferase [Rhagoletis zephyria]XP_036327795.1 dolichyl-phosphate beta-glucosyltransferase [Rhagoletis pomonella]